MCELMLVFIIVRFSAASCIRDVNGNTSGFTGVDQ